MAPNAAFDAQRTALITMELQRGICGDLASFPALREAVAGPVISNTAMLVDRCRHFGIAVVHCTFSLRPDRAGTRLDLPLMAAARKDPAYLLQGTDATEVLPDLNPLPSDIVSDRHHGVSPFSGTTLHETLRAKNIDTLIVTGVSLNVGIPGIVIEAVNLGYSVVVARDAVAGFPSDYATAVLTNTLAAIAQLDTSENIASRIAPTS